MVVASAPADQLKLLLSQIPLNDNRIHPCMGLYTEKEVCSSCIHNAVYVLSQESHDWTIYCTNSHTYHVRIFLIVQLYTLLKLCSVATMCNCYYSDNIPVM